MQDVLAGRNGLRVVQIDVAGQELRNLEPPIPTVPGNNVYLTIDTRLQAAAEASLIAGDQFLEYLFWETFVFQAAW